MLIYIKQDHDKGELVFAQVVGISFSMISTYNTAKPVKNRINNYNYKYRISLNT